MNVPFTCVGVLKRAYAVFQNCSRVALVLRALANKEPAGAMDDCRTNEADLRVASHVRADYQLRATLTHGVWLSESAVGGN
jgi:hypothetical protein